MPRELEACRCQRSLELIQVEHASAAAVGLDESCPQGLLPAGHLRPQALEEDLGVSHDEDMLRQRNKQKEVRTGL